MPYEARLEELGLWSLEERINRADIIEVFKVVKQLSSVPWSQFFRRAEDSVTRGHSWKLVKESCHCDCRLHFFSQRVINRGGYRCSYGQQLQRVIWRREENVARTSLQTECLQVPWLDNSVETWMIRMIGCVLFQNLTNLDRSRFVRRDRSSPLKKNTQIFLVVMGVVIWFSSAQSAEDHALFY